MAPFLSGADGRAKRASPIGRSHKEMVDQTPKSIRSAARALTDLPPRRSRSKTIARDCPSCPGGEICSLIRFPCTPVLNACCLAKCRRYAARLALLANLLAVEFQLSTEQCIVA